MSSLVTLQDWKQAQEERPYEGEGASLFKALNLGEEERVVYWKTIEAVRAGFIGRHTERFFQLLQTLRRRVLSAARDTILEEQIPAAVENALQGHREEYEQEILILYRSTWPTFAERVRDALRGEQSSHADYVRKRVFSDYKQDEDEDFWQREAQGYVSNEGGVLIQEPVGTTRDRIISATRDSVQEGLREGWGSERIAREIDNQTSDVVSRARARKISRTETIRASSVASVSGAQRTASQIGQNLEKEWIETQDDRVRSTHLAVGGSTVPLNGTFTVGGFPAKYPADPQLPARESINCRCSTAFRTIS